MRGKFRALAAMMVLGLVTAQSLPQAGHPAFRSKTRGKEASVSLTLEEVSRRAVATLSASEKNSSVLYLDSEEVKAGTSVELDRKAVEVPWDGYLAFVDLQPTANWGHACRYLLVNAKTGDIQSFDASFPPFLKGASRTLRMVWKGDRVPEWAIAGR